MTDLSKKALLPQGLQDVLPPIADAEAHITDVLMQRFAARGYERVSPPLVEFEDTLFAGGGEVTAPDTFRLMDPVSQKMMGVRADMTNQIARIAVSRLKKTARPLRLSYAGQVLRVRGSQLRPERQFSQVGAEIIGSATAGADAEIIAMAAESLTVLGVRDLSVDLCMPRLVPALCSAFGIRDEDAATLREKLSHKDEAALKDLTGDARDVFQGLLRAVGPAEDALPVLQELPVKGASQAMISELSEVIARLATVATELTLTVDPTEHRDLEYHSGVTFTFFARGVHRELASGGRYTVGMDGGATLGEGEPSTGVTVFTDSILRAVPMPERRKRILLPFGTEERDAVKLREDGWVTVAVLEKGEDTAALAKAQGCTHIFENGKPKAIKP